jgi:glycosyltransferase involved in cell wall biosynthesis
MLGEMPQKIILISSGQPSLNPRLVKEADTLAAAGYKVTVLYAYWNDWGTAMDKKLLPLKKWEAIRVGGDPEQEPFIYFLSRVIYKFSLLITNKTRVKYFAEFAVARSSYFLIRAAKNYKSDLYIGHNLGALPAIVKAAKIYKKPCGFDAEDFHRYELSNNNTDKAVILKTYIEDKYLPRVNYLSASSPQIAGAYLKLVNVKQPVTLLNVFPKNHGIKQPGLNPSQPIKLFWFSQVIGPGRGLDDAVKALQLAKPGHFELHLLGYHTTETKVFFDGLNNGNAKIFYHNPVMPGELPAIASQFDIGLALEPGFSINNDFALSNKIFTYMQAGLAIIASDTTAQAALIDKYPGIGKVYEKGNIKMLADMIEYYSDHSDHLYKAKKIAYDIARNELNWEKESSKFLKIVKDTLAV